MVVELLRPLTIKATSILEAPRSSPPRENVRPTTSSIHPPNRRASRRVEPTSALQLARELADTEQCDKVLLGKLADLATLQLRQGSTADRLQLFFALSRLLGGDAASTESAKRIANIMLTELRPLFMTIAPTLRWTTLASLAIVIERPCFSRTARTFGSGYLCALIPQALEDAASHDKATVYSILHDLNRRGYVNRLNNNRILAGATQHLRFAIRDTNSTLRRRILEQHIALLESRALTSAHAILLAQMSVKEFAPMVAETLNDAERDHFERSVRRALI